MMSATKMWVGLQTKQEEEDELSLNQIERRECGKLAGMMSVPPLVCVRTTRLPSVTENKKRDD